MTRVLTMGEQKGIHYYGSLSHHVSCATDEMFIKKWMEVKHKT